LIEGLSSNSHDHVIASLTTKQQSNLDGFPKAAELIEIEGAHALEASDRAMFNQLLQTARDSGRLTEADAEWEISLAALRRASSKHESNDRIRDSLRRLRRTEVRVTYVSARTGLSRTMETHLLEFTDTDDVDSPAATVQFGIPKTVAGRPRTFQPLGRIRCEISYAMTSNVARQSGWLLRDNQDGGSAALGWDDCRARLSLARVLFSFCW
jgi:hypothetical protein